MVVPEKLRGTILVKPVDMKRSRVQFQVSGNCFTVNAQEIIEAVLKAKGIAETTPRIWLQ